MLALKGYVETPVGLVDQMVDKLFRNSPPSPNSKVLVPGCGRGTFIEGIIRWCSRHSKPLPKICGVEIDHTLASHAMSKFAGYPSIVIENRDFLITDLNMDVAKYKYVIGNPPYVSISQLSEEEKTYYRMLYRTAQGRFDLYMLFFERALQCLALGGRLVFVTPEKYMYVQAAAELRRILAHKVIEEINHLESDVFSGLVTYAAVTTIVNPPLITPLNSAANNLNGNLPSDGSSWLQCNGVAAESGHQLLEICERISCGVATGADSVFVKANSELDSAYKSFAYPTIAGRELTVGNPEVNVKHSMIVPYDLDGKLKSQRDLAVLIPYLLESKVRKKLESRSCVVHKPWYAFHENPPLLEILKPKILCKDITKEPYFWADTKGILVPRHSVYYLVPKNPLMLMDIVDYLNSAEAKSWLTQHCQHAANSFLRLQSHVLKKLPIPQQLFNGEGGVKSEMVLSNARCRS